MFAMIALAKTTMAAFSREAWPFITALILVLLTITVFPPLVTWLPSVLMGAAK
jgi:TRAP-type C4-dicarboxylate transport system permease large subunit